MIHVPGVDGVKDPLMRILRRPEVLEGIRERDTEAAQDCREFKDANMLGERDRLFAAVSALSNLRSWVGMHWDPERQTEAPADTVVTGDGM